MKQKQQAAASAPQKKTEERPLDPQPSKGGASAAVPATPAARVEPARFPDTWRQLIETWKREKPLQARKLEEVHPLNYSPEKIVLAVPEEGLAGKHLLQKDEQLRILTLFRELFDFKGVLTFITRSQALQQEGVAAKAAAPVPTPASASEASPVAPAASKESPAVPAAPVVRGAVSAPPEPVPPPFEAVSRNESSDVLLPETVRSEKMREAELARQQKIRESKEAPFTQHLAAALNATIEAVRLPGD